MDSLNFSGTKSLTVNKKIFNVKWKVLKDRSGNIKAYEGIIYIRFKKNDSVEEKTIRKKGKNKVEVLNKVKAEVHDIDFNFLIIDSKN